jgi:hypothetical protein
MSSGDQDSQACYVLQCGVLATMMLGFLDPLLELWAGEVHRAGNAATHGRTVECGPALANSNSRSSDPAARLRVGANYCVSRPMPVQLFWIFWPPQSRVHLHRRFDNEGGDWDRAEATGRVLSGKGGNMGMNLMSCLFDEQLKLDKTSPKNQCSCTDYKFLETQVLKVQI